MKSKKIFWLMVGSIFIGASSYYLFLYLQKKYEEEKDFNYQLSLIVESNEIKKWTSKLSPAVWKLKVNIPEYIKYEQWDEDYNLPRVLFTARNKSEDYNHVYSMNLNGTDVKLIASHEEFGGAFWPRRGINKPSRSPNGRYIVTTSFNKGFWCTLYDIHKRKSTKLAPYDCRVDYWSTDSKKALINNSGRSGYLDVDSKEITFFKNTYGDDFEKGHGRLFTVENGSQVFSRITEENEYTKKIEGKGKQVVYEMPGFKNPLRGGFLPDECSGGGYYSADRKYFTCNYNENDKDYTVYQIVKPFDAVGKSFGFWVIQPGRWAFQDQRLYRKVGKNENSAFNSIIYYYDAGDDYEITVFSDIYLSKNNFIDYDKENLSGYFPKLPTEEDYRNTYNNIKFGSKE
ncbi:hypothetical protein [Photobacterium sp. 1_MG-2023]|uniref:hypothetical protein n=1 Tax=Photobacterium sp. 1_MG-2023 TaxID=3062646 RepID=UPI0026E384AD|nr:hypothetical protein [Photobacterium sp. 1_MG-2023]MDO6706081.1 hypothetical protein [Photobacterium sp. 1_MG-2023]